MGPVAYNCSDCINAVYRLSFTWFATHTFWYCNRRHQNSGSCIRVSRKILRDYNLQIPNTMLLSLCRKFKYVMLEVEWLLQLLF